MLTFTVIQNYCLMSGAILGHPDTNTAFGSTRSSDHIFNDQH